MSLTLRLIVALSFHMAVRNVPASHGRVIKGYRATTLSDVLTPTEKTNYLMTGKLPSRITYSTKHHAYMVNGKFLNDDVKRKNQYEQHYEVIPRYQYLLRKLMPSLPSLSTDSLMEHGLTAFSLLQSMGLGGSHGDADEDDNGGDEDETQGKKNEADDDVSIEKKDDEKEEKKDEKEEKKDEKEEKKDEKEEKKDEKEEKKDEKDDKKDEDEITISDFLPDAKTVIKFGAGFLPGGPAIVAALENSEKINDKIGKIGKVSKMF